MKVGLMRRNVYFQRYRVFQVMILFHFKILNQSGFFALEEWQSFKFPVIPSLQNNHMNFYVAPEQYSRDCDSRSIFY